MLHRTPPSAQSFVRSLSKIWLALLVFSSIVAASTHAHAYPWMIRHGYSQCTQCHVDPSGSGPMTQYGRAMGELIMRTHYDFEPAPDEDAKTGQFLFGLLNLPDELGLGGDVSLLSQTTKVDHVELERALIWMQIEGNAAVQTGRFVASGSLGYSPQGALGATLTRGPDSNLISREHWLGLWLDDGHDVLVRGGRMNVPFGVRSIEHTLWARVYTHTDINDAQQYGLSATFMGDKYRAEVQGIVGNFELRPDIYRERGYSAYCELLPTSRLGVGASSRIVHVDLDTSLLRAEWRHAHGVFSRWATGWDPLVLMTEWDYVFESPKYLTRRTGVVGYLQADIEPTQGLHFIATGEASDIGVGAHPASWSGWLSYDWFFAPHADIRLDNLFQSLGSTSGRTTALSLLLQAHVYL